MSGLRIALFGIVACAALGCAPIPAPRVLDEADELSRSPAAQEIKEYAEPSWARAEKRRLEAHEALEKGPQARAQFLGEESIALFHEGVALARLAKATLREKAAGADQDALEKELLGLDAEQARAASDVDALEGRVHAAKTIGPNAAHGPEAEGDRRDAARAFLVQGKLLCASARILGAGGGASSTPPASADDPTSAAVVAHDLTAAEAEIASLEAALGDPKKPADPEAAARARASCSSVLGRARRTGASKTSSGSADALLEEVSAMAARSKGAPLDPARDERGVVVTMRNVFEKDALTQAARDRVAELDRVANAHKGFPVAVVIHTDRALTPTERAQWEARGGALAAALASVDSTRKVVIVAGDAVPVVSRSSSERASNARVEIVFIAPEAL